MAAFVPELLEEATALLPEAAVSSTVIPEVAELATRNFIRSQISNLAPSVGETSFISRAANSAANTIKNLNPIKTPFAIESDVYKSTTEPLSKKPLTANQKLKKDIQRANTNYISNKNYDTFNSVPKKESSLSNSTKLRFKNQYTNVPEYDMDFLNFSEPESSSKLSPKIQETSFSNPSERQSLVSPYLESGEDELFNVNDLKGKSRITREINRSIAKKPAKPSIFQRVKNSFSRKAVSAAPRRLPSSELFSIGPVDEENELLNPTQETSFSNTNERGTSERGTNKNRVNRRFDQPSRIRNVINQARSGISNTVSKLRRGRVKTTTNSNRRKRTGVRGNKRPVQEPEDRLTYDWDPNEMSGMDYSNVPLELNNSNTIPKRRFSTTSTSSSASNRINNRNTRRTRGNQRNSRSRGAKRSSNTLSNALLGANLYGQVFGNKQS